MDEKENAERFNRRLDEWLDGGPAGPEIPGVAFKLAKADFSKGSGIKDVLRRRLLERQAGPFWRFLWPVPLPLAAAAALLVLVAVFPLRHALRRAPQPGVPPPGRICPQDVIESFPADRLLRSCRPVDGDSPFRAVHAQSVFSTALGREVFESRPTSLDELIEHVKL